MGLPVSSLIDPAADNTGKGRFRVRAAVGRFAGFVPVVEEAGGVGVVDDAEPELVGVRAEPRTAPDDLLEGDHRGNGLHENDITDAGRVHAGGKQIDGGGDDGHLLFRVLKALQQGLAGGAFLGNDADGVFRDVQVGVESVQFLRDLQGVIHVDAEDHRLFHASETSHEFVHVVAELFHMVGHGDLALELRHVVTVLRVGFRRDFELRALGRDFLYDQPVLGEVGDGAVHLVGGKETVVDALAERIGEDRIAEVFIGVDILGALWRGGHAELHGAVEMLEDGVPGAEAGAVAFVDDDEIEEIPWVLVEQALTVRAGKHGLVDAEIDGAVFRGLAFGDDVALVLEGLEGVIGLIAQNIAVGEKENARVAVLAGAFHLA